VENLPPGFAETSETYTDQFDMSYIAVSSLKDTPSGDRLTLPTPAPTTRGSSPGTNTSSTSLSSAAPLQILSLTSKDAGIGDGSIYVYVEVINNSSELYSCVGLERTCYSASGGILGTGLGNTANVAPGETVVVTMIFLSVPGCDNVKVRFDALTELV
jgi:hypothetical protein